MPKSLLFGLAAVGNFVVAVITYSSGRLIIPIILTFGGLCFIIAAIGAARGGAGNRS